MTPEQFVNWLQGMIDATGGELSSDQTALVLDKASKICVEAHTYASSYPYVPSYLRTHYVAPSPTTCAGLTLDVSQDMVPGEVVEITNPYWKR